MYYIIYVESDVFGSFGYMTEDGQHADIHPNKAGVFTESETGDILEYLKTKGYSKVHVLKTHRTRPTRR